jgi:peptidoglycan/LPS O-acetylase OafA/YrhL
MNYKDKTFGLNSFLIFFSIVLCVLLILFDRTDGFVAHIYDSYNSFEVSYSKDYMSSGSNDDGVIWFMMLYRCFFIVFGLINFKGYKNFYLFVVLFALDLFCLVLVSDTSNVSKTISINPYLRFWFLVWVISLFLNTWIYLKSRQWRERLSE